MLRYSLALTLLLGGSAPLWAEFPDGVLDEKQHDFGVVPQGQQLVHYFRVVNTTDKPLHIYNVRVSCGCTTARALENTIAPGKETAVWASMDSRRFSGYKQVFIYVSFDQPRYEELRTAVAAVARSDISFSSDAIAFGKVNAGEAKTASVNVTVYNGSIQITDPKSDSSFVSPTVKEVRRTASETVYEVSAKLSPETPAGAWFTDLWVQTNDPNMAKLRVPLTVEVDKVQAASTTPAPKQPVAPKAKAAATSPTAPATEPVSTTPPATPVTPAPPRQSDRPFQSILEEAPRDAVFPLQFNLFQRS
jgi:hypothetical protein